MAGGGMAGTGMAGAGAAGRGGEQLVVPRARPDSYYGKPIIKAPVWRSPEVPGYLFLGGLAGASSVLAGFAQRPATTGRPGRRRSLRPGPSGCPGWPWWPTWAARSAS